MKNKILKFIMSVDITALFVSACFLESDSNIPFIIMVFCILVFLLFAYANDFFKKI